MNTTKQAPTLATKKIEQDQFIKFLQGGNSIFTLKSLKTGNRFTYKVVTGDHAPIFFVKVLTGSDNTSDYTDIATIKALKNEFPTITRTVNNKRITVDSPCYKAFEFVFFNAIVGIKMPLLEIWHEGRCCRCGRRLTVPESVESGIGPECATKQSFNYL